MHDEPYLSEDENLNAEHSHAGIYICLSSLDIYNTEYLRDVKNVRGWISANMNLQWLKYIVLPEGSAHT